jgi:hypothetical protein
MILETDAVEDVRSGRQAFHQRFGGEIGLRQRVDEDGAVDRAEALGGGGLKQHARRPVAAPPHDAGIDRDVARLHAVADERPIRRAAESGPGDHAGRSQCGR